MSSILEAAFAKIVEACKARHVACALLALVPFGIACSTSDAPASATDAFRGRLLRIVVGSSAGGGYDIVARVLAAHLGRHLPGGPAVVIDNMPGAGGLIAANFIAR